MASMSQGREDKVKRSAGRPVQVSNAMGTRSIMILSFSWLPHLHVESKILQSVKSVWDIRSASIFYPSTVLNKELQQHG